jgi:hypothetical protein
VILFQALAEIVLLLAAVFVLPRVARGPGLKWLLRSLAVLLVVVLLHGRQLLAALLISMEAGGGVNIAATTGYCAPLDVVSFVGDVADIDDLPDGLPFQPPRPYHSSSFLDVEESCGPNCVTWLRTGLARRVYTGVNNQAFRMPYAPTMNWPDNIREVHLSHSRECEMSYDNGLWTTGTPSLFKQFAPRPLTPLARGRWDYSCFSYDSPPAHGPLILANQRRTVTNLPLGLQRIVLERRVIEHFSQEVIASSTQIAIYGAAPTFMPDAYVQHVSRGVQLSEYDLMSLYRAQNCTHRDRPVRDD